MLHFERVVCVSLDRRQDRWQQFHDAIPDDWPFAIPERHQAIDGKRCRHPDHWRAGGGAWGCYRSHIRIIEDCLNNSIDSLLLLEDDAECVPEFADGVASFSDNVPSDVGMVYFGGQHLHAKQHGPQRINEHVYRPWNVNRTHAFGLLSRDAMIAVYQHLAASNWRPSHHIDHHLGRFHQRSFELAAAGQPHTAVYCPSEWLIAQAAGQSNVSGKTVPTRIWAPAEKLEADPSRPFVAVLGLHSSGSSCVAMILEALGVHMGNKLGGFHGGEAVGLADLCEKIYPFPTTTTDWPAGKIDKRLRRWINAKRREAAERRTIAGGKYPHLCALAPTIKQIVGDDLLVIDCDRPLKQSIESLQHRSKKAVGWLHVSDESAADTQRWLWSLKREFLDAHEHLQVNYDALLSDPATAVALISNYLEIDPTAEQRAAAIAVVDPSRRTVVTT